MIQAQNERVVLLAAPQAMTNSATVTANLDTLQATSDGRGEYVKLVFNFASEINTNAVGPTIAVLHCDTTVVSSFVTVTANRTAEDISAAKNIVYMIDTKTLKRYLRISVTTATATNDNVTFGCNAHVSRLKTSPGNTTDMVRTSVDVVVTV